MPWYALSICNQESIASWVLGVICDVIVFCIWRVTHLTLIQLSTGFGNEDQKEEVEGEESMAGMNEQYFDYIEQSLDTLISTSVNPLLMWVQ